MSRYMFWLIILLSFSAASCSGRPETYYFGDYSEAEQHYNKGEYEEAILKYNAYIDENPEGHMAVISKYYVAKSHVELGDTAQAKALYQEIVEKYPDVVWANFSKTQLEEMEKSSQT